MKIRIKTYNGDLLSYLTEGKVYEVIFKISSKGGEILLDNGNIGAVRFDRSAHLNGGSWEVVDE